MQRKQADTLIFTFQSEHTPLINTATTVTVDVKGFHGSEVFGALLVFLAVHCEMLHGKWEQEGITVYVKKNKCPGSHLISDACQHL